MMKIMLQSGKHSQSGYWRGSLPIVLHPYCFKKPLFELHANRYFKFIHRYTIGADSLDVFCGYQKRPVCLDEFAPRL